MPSTRSARTTKVKSFALGVILFAPLALVTDIQRSLETTNLVALLLGCAPLFAATIASIPAHVLPIPTQVDPLTPIRGTATLLGVGAVMTAGAPSSALAAVGLALIGAGAGWLLRPTVETRPLLTGFVVGPMIGTVIAGVHWRIYVAAVIATAVLAVLAALLPGDDVPVQAVDDDRFDRRTSRFARALVVVSAPIGVLGSTLILRASDLLVDSALATGVMFSIGGFLGVWRGSSISRRGLHRRSIRQGAWISMLASLVGGTLLHLGLVPQAVAGLIAFLVGFGWARVQASLVCMLSRSSPNVISSVWVRHAMVGCSLGLVAVCTIGREGLIDLVRETAVAYAATDTEVRQLAPAIASLPEAFALADDPRLGRLGGPLRASAFTMAGQHQYLSLLGIAVVSLLTLVLSLALPRSRSQRSRSAVALQPDRRVTAKDSV